MVEICKILLPFYSFTSLLDLLPLSLSLSLLFSYLPLTKTLQFKFPGQWFFIPSDGKMIFLTFPNCFSLSWKSEVMNVKSNSLQSSQNYHNNCLGSFWVLSMNIKKCKVSVKSQVKREVVVVVVEVHSLLLDVVQHCNECNELWWQMLNKESNFESKRKKDCPTHVRVLC